MNIKDLIEKIAIEFPAEGIRYDEQGNRPGLSFKGKWYDLSGYNFLAQVTIVVDKLQTLLR